MHDISNNLSPNISNVLTYQANIHSYDTRASSRGDYFVKSSRLDKQKSHFQEMVLESGIAYPVKCAGY